MIICAGDIEQFEFAKSMGIGLIDIAINLTKVCLVNPPKSILFVGSAGSYGDKKLLEIVESSSATNIENGFFNANSYTPTKNIISIINNVSHETISNSWNYDKYDFQRKQILFNNNVSHETIVNSSNYITTDSNLAKLYLSTGIDIENMEFFSVLNVAKKFHIPVKGVFIVTNYCNEYAHRDFIHNHKKAMNILTKYIKKREQ